MNPPRKTIRPYVNYSIDFKNLYTYRDFLKKRPKKTHHFKFSIHFNQQLFVRTYEKQTQLKLLRILKTVQPLIKVDLKEFQTVNSHFWKAVLLSAWKRISHVKALFVTVMKPEAKSVRKYFKYFPRLELLNYQMDDPSTMFRLNLHLQNDPSGNYLKSLKYCPKIHSLTVQDFGTNLNLGKANFESRRYFRSLHNLALRSESLNFAEHFFPIEFCENLRSISLGLFSILPWPGLSRVMNLLPNLSHLKEINLSIRLSQVFNFANVFQEIAKKGVLESISFEFGCLGMLNLDEILEALKLSKLRYFSLRTEAQTGLFGFISDFIRNMSSLESFELDISNSNLYSNDNDYIELCKQINKLQKLQSLKLHLDYCAKVFKTPRIKCFIPYLSDLFKKPIKIQHLHLVCNKLPPSESLQNFISAVGSSTPFLTHLRIDFGTLPYTKKTYRSLLPLLKNLSKIQVLKLPALAVNGSTSQLLIEMAKTLHGCIYLRELNIGEIKETAVVSDVFQAVEIILSKRGLRQFYCLTSEGFRKNLFNGEHTQFPDWKRIIEKNPHLDTVTLMNNLNWLIYCQQQRMLSL